MKGGNEHRENREARAARHADSRCQPNNSGRRETANAIASHEDQAAADEADAGHDLRGDTRAIEDDALAQHVAKPILGNEHDERRREPDERIGPQARALLAYLALKADEGGQHERQGEFADLEPSLTCEFANSAFDDPFHWRNRSEKRGKPRLVHQVGRFIEREPPSLAATLRAPDTARGPSGFPRYAN